MTAIKDTGNQLVAATDPRDSVGVLDRYFLDTKFFPEIERFDRIWRSSGGGRRRTGSGS